MIRKKFVYVLITIMCLGMVMPPMRAAASGGTPTLESELHRFTDERVVGSSGGDLVIPVFEYMRVNTRMNGGISGSVPFFSSPSTAWCRNNQLGFITNQSIVFVYAVTAERFEGRHWALIDYDGRFGMVHAQWIEYPTAWPNPSVDVNEFAAEVFNLVNTAREICALPPVFHDYALSAVAMQRAREISLHFSNERPDGQCFSTLTAEHGVRFTTQGESIAFGHESPLELILDLLDATANRGLMLYGGYRYLGVGVYINDEGILFWVKLFAGQRITETPAPTPQPTPRPLQPTSIVVIPSNVQTIHVGATRNLTAHVNPLNAYDPRVTWSSSNPSVATVLNGTVSALSEGEAIITATTVNGLHASVTIVVPRPYSTITIPDRRLTVAERQEWIDDYNALGGASEFELEVVRLVNEIRIDNNLSTVTIDDALMMAARFYSQTMHDLNTGLGHNRGPYAVPDATHGASANVAAAFGGRLRWNGGNAALGFRTPEGLVNGWMNSEGHRRYILSPEHLYIGVGHFRSFSYMFLSNRSSR